MTLFPFFKKSPEESELASIPIFSELSPRDLKIVRNLLRLMECKRGDFIYHQGDPPDAFYILVSGRLRAIQKSSDGRERTVAYFHRGDSFGESSILSGHAHSVSIEVLNDAILYKMEKEEFKEALKTFPSISVHLSRRLSTSIRERERMSRTIAEAQIISIMSMHPGLGRTTFAINFATSLAIESQKKVLVLEMGSTLDLKEEVKSAIFDSVTPLLLSEYHDHQQIQTFLKTTPFGFQLLHVRYMEDMDEGERKINSLLGSLLEQFHFVFVKLPDRFCKVSFKALSQSDKVYLLADPSAAGISKCRDHLHELKNTFHFTSHQLRLVMSEVDPDIEAVKEREALVKHHIFATLIHVEELVQEKASKVEPYIKRFPEEKYSRVIRYLAREEAGILVGLALGSGAAFGLAHIGVLRVLEREKIPVDILSGSSIGALVSVFWAAGFNSFQLEEVVHDLSSKEKSFWNIIGPFDFSLPHRGFFKGNTIVQYLRKHLGHKTFRDLKVPVRVLAMNVFSTEEVVFEEGDVVDAIRASISIPGILRPVSIERRYLIDGGIVEPVPVRVLASAGIRKIIAVNVLQGPQDRLARMKIENMKKLDVRQKLKGHPIKQWWANVGDAFSKRYEANIFNVLMHTIQSMEYSIAAHSCREADVILNPVSPDSNWIEFYNPKKFIQLGIEETEKHLDRIKRMVAEQ